MTPLPSACASRFAALAARIGPTSVMQSRIPPTRKCPSRGDVQVGAGDIRLSTGDVRLSINEGPFSRFEHSVERAQFLAIGSFASGRNQERLAVAMEFAICRQEPLELRGKVQGYA